jgi:hypothetical protein
MIKHYCDLCGKEVIGMNRMKRCFDRVKVEVITAVDGTWNQGDLCTECIIKSVTKGIPFDGGR